jgi:hypothetical protein
MESTRGVAWIIVACISGVLLVRYVFHQGWVGSVCVALVVVMMFRAYESDMKDLEQRVLTKSAAIAVDSIIQFRGCMSAYQYALEQLEEVDFNRSADKERALLKRANEIREELHLDVVSAVACGKVGLQMRGVER